MSQRGQALALAFEVNVIAIALTEYLDDIGVNLFIEHIEKT